MKMGRGQATAISMVIANCLSLAVLTQAHAQETGVAESRLDALQQQLDRQTSQLESLRADLAAQEQSVAGLQQAINEERLQLARGR